MCDNKSGDITWDFGERGFEGDDYLDTICPVYGTAKSHRFQLGFEVVKTCSRKDINAH